MLEPEDQAFVPGSPEPPPTHVVLPEPDLPPELAPPAEPTLEATGAPTDDEAHRCIQNEDCVLVTGQCGEIVAARRDHAEQVQRDFTAIASVSECARAAPHDPVDPTCGDHLCTTTPAREADARTCADDHDCEAVAITCQWHVASRTAPGYAHLVEIAAATSAGPAPPCVPPTRPIMACRYGYCSATTSWVGASASTTEEAPPPPATHAAPTPRHAAGS